MGRVIGVTTETGTGLFHGILLIAFVAFIAALMALLVRVFK